MVQFNNRIRERVAELRGAECFQMRAIKESRRRRACVALLQDTYDGRVYRVVTYTRYIRGNPIGCMCVPELSRSLNALLNPFRAQRSLIDKVKEDKPSGRGNP